MSSQVPDQNVPRPPRVVRGPKRDPPRILLYGVEGVGKSSFAGGRRLPDGTVVEGAPRPIFLDLDRGSGALDVARLGDPDDPENPVPSSYAEVVNAVRWLKDPGYRGDRMTLVVDTADKLEREVIWPEVCRRYVNVEKPDAPRPRDIGEIGWAKGYVQALSVWAEFLRELDHLQAVSRMGIIILAHSRQAKVENLRGSDYSAYEPDLYVGKNSSAAELLREWADCVFFAGFDDDARREAGDAKKAAAGIAKTGKGFTTGERRLWTVHQGWCWAKNRYCLGEELDLAWRSYADGVDAYFSGAWAAQPRTPEVLRRMIASACDTVAGWPETAEDWRTVSFAPHLERAGDDVEQLTKLLEQLTKKISARTARLRGSAE